MAALDAVYAPTIPYSSIESLVVVQDSAATSSPRSLFCAQALLASILVTTGGLGEGVPRVVLVLVACASMSAVILDWPKSCKWVRTLHGGVLCCVDSVCNDETWFRSARRPPFDLRPFSLRIICQRLESLHIPAAKKGAIGLTVGVLAKPYQRRRGWEPIDVRTGAGNFLKGATPNQDILNVW